MPENVACIRKFNGTREAIQKQWQQNANQMTIEFVRSVLGKLRARPNESEPHADHMLARLLAAVAVAIFINAVYSVYCHSADH